MTMLREAKIATSVAESNPPSRSRPRLRTVGFQLVLVVLTVMTLYPLAWMVGSSFKPLPEIFSTVNPIPQNWEWVNYPQGWTAQDPNFGNGIANSLIIATLAAIGAMVSSAMAGYAFARLRFPAKRLAFAFMLLTIMLPSQATVIPQYIVFFNVGLVDTFWPLVLPHFFATSGFFIFLMVQFMRGLPRELEEAALIDGCGSIRVFFAIILPLLKAPLISTGILTFIWTYDDFFGQLIYLSEPEQRTIPVMLSSFLDAESGAGAYGPMLAMSVVSVIPVLIIFSVAQKRIVEGVATTGIKG